MHQNVDLACRRHCLPDRFVLQRFRSARVIKKDRSSALVHVSWIPEAIVNSPSVKTAKGGPRCHRAGKEWTVECSR